jgi:hypothetical protein
MLEVPPDHIYCNDTMALNVSTIAPQFYDYESESFHHSWTYGMFIDHVIGNKFYFPEYLYFRKSVENDEGILYINSRMVKGDDKKRPNLRLLPARNKVKMVLAPALAHAKALGYNKAILVGCDYCLIDRKRYWWEYPEYCDGILAHESNKYKPVLAKGLEFKKETVKNKPPTNGNVRSIAVDKSCYEYRDRFKHTSQYSNVKTTDSDNILTGLVDENFEVYKFRDMGMLKLPVVDELDEL